MSEYSVAMIVLSILGGVWGIVSGTGKIVKPLIEAITKLNVNVENLAKDLKELKEDNTGGHKRIWEKNDEQDKALQNHETRLELLEHSHNTHG